MQKSIVRQTRFVGGIMAVLAVLCLFSDVAHADFDAPVPDTKPEFLGLKEERGLTHKLLSFSVPMPPENKPAPPPKGEVSREQLEIYKRIFALQEVGDIEAADLEIKRLNDHRLMGYVLYQRYMHPTAYTSEFAELEEWLLHYNTYPEAEKIYKLAERKKTKGASLDKPPSLKRIKGMEPERADFREEYISSRERSSSEITDIRKQQKLVYKHVRQGRPSKALELLNNNEKKFDRVEFNMLVSRVAAGFLFTGDVNKALKLASEASEESGVNVPLAGWVAGLASWRLKQYQESAKFFEITARSPYANGWTISGAAFWASRAHMRTKNFKDVSYWLNRATNFPRTFYGLIALRAMNRKVEFNWDVPAFDQKARDAIAFHPVGVRALALYDIGRIDEAERELSYIPLAENLDLKMPLLAFAVEARMASLAWNLSGRMSHGDGRQYDAALYPLMPWEPEGGHKIDRSLVHALARQESRFNPSAGNSNSGATGLLQLMPATAKEVAGEALFEKVGGAKGLKDPVFNLTVAENYIEYLFKHYTDDKDLFELMIAWNAGPGNLRKWQKNLKSIDDSLLFIESIPAYETRAFVERVTTNYWIYRMRLGQETPSLDEVAAGRTPLYVAQEPPSALKIAKK